MWLTAALSIFLAAGVAAGPQQKTPELQAGPSATIPCDPDGAIHCLLQETETVTGSRSLDDVRVIAHYISLIAERNRRHYMAWGTEMPSAAFELARRVKRFPYVPYGDTYSIVGMDVALSQKEDRLSISYPKHPKQDGAAPVAEKDHAIYSTKLSVFIDALEKEILKLKKYEK